MCQPVFQKYSSLVVIPSIEILTKVSFGLRPGACTARVVPAFNRAVLFDTTAPSFHGLPEPIECPADTARRSIALYYMYLTPPRAAASAHSQQGPLRPRLTSLFEWEAVSRGDVAALALIRLNRYSYAQVYFALRKRGGNLKARMWVGG